MKPDLRPTSTWKPISRLALAMLVGVVVGSRSEGFAASVGVGAGPSGVEDATPHHCKCGQKCRGGSCCCKRGASKKPGAVARPTSPALDSSRMAANPCMKAAPCGDPQGSNHSSADPIGRPALFDLGSLPFAPGSTRFKPASSPSEGPARRAERLDDPPESPFVD